MYKKILLAYNGSEVGQRALLESKELAQWRDSDLELVSVASNGYEGLGVYGEAVFADTAIDDREKEQQRILDAGIALLAEHGFKAKGHLLSGDVVTEITEYAKRVQADLIVIGHEYKENWIARWWSGSNSVSLVERSPCSVLVVVSKAG
ncbi:MAG: universal stress protein [Bordetella sp.]|jgi:nucleotide-binding universal stress UspA family protein